MADISKLKVNNTTYDLKDSTARSGLNNKVDKNGTDSLMTADEHTKLGGIEDGAEVNVQANWTQTTTTADDYIKNKPTLGTAAAKDIPSSGNASTSQVVMGNDTRLSDARTPTSHTHTKSQITDFPSSLPASNTTDSYSSTGTAPVSGKAVAAALGTLDVSSVGGRGKYIQAISETDGKISATAATMPTSLPASNTTDTYSATGTAPVSGKAVAAALATLPEPMVFKGSVGTNGTVTTLPTDGSATIGDTYKVITAGTYAGQASKVGDTFICQTKTSSANTWVLIPSGDEPSGTVTSVATGTGLTGGTITSSGTISHADTSSQASVSNSGRTYIQSVTLDGMGHVTGLSSATETVTNTDTKVTSSANHYAPATASGSDISASATGASAAWNIDVVKGVTLNTDGKGHVTGMSVTSGKIPANPNTDTKVTSSANHYTPSTASGSDKSASASGATAAWSIDVVKGVTLNTDGKGHVTGLSVTSGKIPANPNTDRYVNSAAFASQGTNGASGSKLTLTRAGSDTATVTATMPVATTSAAGVMSGAMVTKLNDMESEIDEIKNEMSSFCYSYKIDMSDSNPATCVKPHFDSRYGCDNFNFTPVHMDYANNKFDYGSWEGFINRIVRPCMLKYNGTVDYYLDPDDYSKKITGEASDVANVNYQGNVMVELEKLYFKRYTYNGVQYCFISDRKLDNSFKCYAHHDKYGNELDYIYRACYDGMYDGTRLRSISGVNYHNLNALTSGYIMSNATRQEEINFAQANNVSTENGEGWNILHKSEWDYINDILILISMSTDTQTTFGRGRDSGYVDTTNTGVISTGTMNAKGLFWGKNDGSAGVKVLGIENPWANLSKSCAGWIKDNNTQKVKYTYGTEDGSTGEGFNTNASGYISITGATPTKGDSSTSGVGYITAWQYDEYGTIPYETISGASNKYLCDEIYFNNASVCFAHVGGSSGDGLACGAFCSDLYYNASRRNWYFGAALSYKGLAA